MHAKLNMYKNGVFKLLDMEEGFEWCCCYVQRVRRKVRREREELGRSFKGDLKFFGIFLGLRWW
jgi:hypothetical protein